MNTIDIYGDFAEEHCLVYANAEVLYRAESYFLLSLFYYSVFVLNGHIKMWYSFYFSQHSKYIVLCYLLQQMGCHYLEY